jgi:hypothetical protein
MKARLLLLLLWPLILLFDCVVQVWFGVCLIFNVPRATAIALGYDRLGNVAMNQGNETLSSWAGRNNSWLEPVIDWIFKILTGEKNHCDNNREK